MGAGNSNTKKSKKVDRVTYRKTHTYGERKATFQKMHDLFDQKVMPGTFGSEIPYFEQVPPMDVETNLNRLYKKYESTFKKAKISKEMYSPIMYDIYAEHILKQKMLTKNFDIFKLIDELYLYLKLGDMQNEHYKNLQYLFQKEFETSLSLCSYSAQEIVTYPFQIQLGINRRMKFTSEYHPNILIVYLNDEFLSNKELIDDFCDVVSNCPVLQIVSLILYPLNKDADHTVADNYGLGCDSYQSFYKLVEAISKNRKIKGLFVHSIKDYGISLAPEIFYKILEKLQSETLVAFHFGNFRLSEALMGKLMFQLANTRILKFLSLHLDGIQKLLIPNLLPTIKGNLSLLAFVITNLSKEDDKKIIDNFEKGFMDFLGEERKEKERAEANGVSVKTTAIEMHYLGKASIVNLVVEKKNRRKEKS